MIRSSAVAERRRSGVRSHHLPGRLIRRLLPCGADAGSSKARRVSSDATVSQRPRSVHFIWLCICTDSPDGVCCALIHGAWLEFRLIMSISDDYGHATVTREGASRQPVPSLEAEMS